MGNSEVCIKKQGNSPAREEWFKDQAFGMFIHMGLDVLIGSVISHWMIGADPALVERFIREMPGDLHLRRFAADDYASLAKQAGMKYAVFGTKHHAGFCLFDTKTTDFNIINTPFGRDMTREVLEACRKKGIATGCYFSPYDFYWCHKAGKKLHFATPEVLPANNPGLMEYNKAQVRELMSCYGPMDVMFFDGPPEELTELVWGIQPDTVITRGAMETPERVMPDEPIAGPWEACHTIGDGWSYKPTNDTVKTGAQLIDLLIRIRAKGGNLLLNVTPDPYGCIPVEQERILQEIGLFLFFNGEAIYDIRPWHITNEKNIWFTRAKDADTVYAFVTGGPWPYGYEGRKEITIKSVKTTEKTEIEMVGQSGEVLEHRPEEDTKTRWHQDENGLHINAMRCYRPYCNHKWPNPSAFRITHAGLAK